MDFKVVFLDTFLDDLEKIIRDIAVDNPDAAYRLGELIISKSERLTFFPERHPRLRQRPTIRRFIVKRHFKVFYRVRLESRMVEVLRCWDGRRESEPFIPEPGN